jgi:hypothetical protein
MQKVKADIDCLRKNLILFVSVTILCFFLAETTIRLLGEYDVDGEFMFMGHRVRPYRLPHKSLKELVIRYDSLNDSHIAHHPLLGWSIANNTCYWLGDCSNSIGIRSPREFELNKSEDTLRIELFGDSFVYGADVTFEQTWGYRLEKKVSRDFNVEVMNFGVGGYGNDQAYLRWKIIGKKYRPDIVLIGFQEENCIRNRNVIRKFLFKNTLMPFSKPRFILSNSSLKLVNYPPLHYSKVPDTVKNFDESPLVEYEHYYNPDDYSTRNPLFYSKLASTLITVAEKNTRFKWSAEAEDVKHELCYAILKKFVEEASEESDVYIIHIPTYPGLVNKMNSGAVEYEQLLNRLKKEVRLIDPTDRLIDEVERTTIESLFEEEYKWHYSNKSNAILAEVVYDSIINESKRIIET